jgi:hypothetical protein
VEVCDAYTIVLPRCWLRSLSVVRHNGDGVRIVEDCSSNDPCLANVDFDRGENVGELVRDLNSSGDADDVTP